MRAALSLFLFTLLACGVSQPDTATTRAAADQQMALDTAFAYRTAIADYIHVMDTSASPLPDTVYIGRHPEFPRIELPAVIARRSVLLVYPPVGESEKHSPRFAYLNIFPTYTPGQVEFYVIRFAQGLSHQPDGAEDCHLYYRVSAKEGSVLDRVSR